MTPQWVTTAGLVCDIFGAVLVAIEVVNKFDGDQFELGQTYDTLTKPPKKTMAFIQWELSKFKTMKLGLIFLLVGFALQIAGTWLQAI
jgi:hypothetical protein